MPDVKRETLQAGSFQTGDSTAKQRLHDDAVAYDKRLAASFRHDFVNKTEAYVRGRSACERNRTTSGH